MLSYNGMHLSTGSEGDGDSAENGGDVGGDENGEGLDAECTIAVI